VVLHRAHLVEFKWHKQLLKELLIKRVNLNSELISLQLLKHVVVDETLDLGVAQDLVHDFWLLVALRL